MYFSSSSQCQMQNADGLGNYSILLLDWWRLIKCLHSFSSFYPHESWALKLIQLSLERGAEHTSHCWVGKREAGVWSRATPKGEIHPCKPLAGLCVFVGGAALGAMGHCEQPGLCLQLRLAPPPLLPDIQCWSRAHHLCSCCSWDVQIWPFPSTG